MPCSICWHSSFPAPRWWERLGGESGLSYARTSNNLASPGKALIYLSPRRRPGSRGSILPDSAGMAIQEFTASPQRNFSSPCLNALNAVW
jgi:hypothetical protein